MILLFILVWGMFAGWIAHLLLARNQPINWAELLVIGLAGSFVGGLLISLLSGDGLALRPSGIIGSIVGAVVLFGGPGGPSGPPRAAGPAVGNTSAATSTTGAPDWRMRWVVCSRCPPGSSILGTGPPGASQRNQIPGRRASAA